MNSNQYIKPKTSFLQLGKVNKQLAWSWSEMISFVLLVVIVFFVIPAKAQMRELTVTEAVCEDLATFIYWSSTEQLSKANKEEARKAQSELRQPSSSRPRISESQICEADFIAAVSHGNSGNGNKMIPAREDAIFASLSAQRLCLTNNGKLPPQAPFGCKK